MSEEMVVRYCSPTLAGLKTGSLFGCAFADEEKLYQEIRQLNQLLKEKGLRILPMRYQNQRALIYVYRPKKLKEDLGCCKVCQILKEQGYTNLNQNQCLAELMTRLRTKEAFPHEIGLFLGYPPEDVTGFIQKQECKLTGYWKVYHHQKEAMKTFTKYRKCTEIYLREYHRGKPLEKLAVRI